MGIIIAGFGISMVLQNVELRQARPHRRLVFGLKVSSIKRVASPSPSAKMALRLDSLPPSYRLRGDARTDVWWLQRT
jgi:hypothetical protein